MIEIEWLAFLKVFVAALLGAVLVVGFYSVGLRLLVRAGRPPVVAPAEFTDAITVITPKEAARAAKAPARTLPPATLASKAPHHPTPSRSSRSTGCP